MSAYLILTIANQCKRLVTKSLPKNENPDIDPINLRDLHVM
jgi:hypothetical protein